jgi:hypothetical protein
MRSFDALTRAGSAVLGEAADLTQSDADGPSRIRRTFVWRIEQEIRAHIESTHRPSLREDILVRSWLNIPELSLATLNPWLSVIATGDPKFGFRSAPGVSLGDLFEMRVANVPGIVGIRGRLREGLIDIAERLTRPVDLLTELRSAVAPPDKAAAAFIAREGWDGRGRKTLDVVGQEMGVTRERVRQLTKKVKDTRLARLGFLPTTELLLQLVDEAGGAMSLRQLAAVGLLRRLIVAEEDIQALSSAADLGLLRNGNAVVDGDKGAIATTGEALGAFTALLHPADDVRRVLRKLIRRRGVVNLNVAARELGLEDWPVERITALVLDGNDLSITSDRVYVWQPSDPESAFLSRVAKLLLVRGPQRLDVVSRALKRERKRMTEFGTTLPANTLKEVLERSPFISVEGGRYGWVGPKIGVHVGIAEQALLELFARHGPAIHTSVLHARLVPAGVDPVTLGIALSNSILIDRIAPAIYTLAGEPVLPSEVEDARAEAVRSDHVSSVARGWIDGKFELAVTVRHARGWNGFLRVPDEGNLGGSWSLVDGDQTWNVVVSSTQLRNGVRPWFRDHGGVDGRRFLLRFEHSSRSIAVQMLDTN